MENTLPGSFEELLKTHDKPILVDFWATWCGPCKMVAPELEKFAQSHKGKVTVVKVDIDEQPDIAQKYGILSVPTLMLFKAGQISEKVVGAIPQAQMEKVFGPKLA
ncbi:MULTISPECIES: thioredoxin [Leptospira]|nr:MULTISPECIES: thioredoxin [Leptospira]PNV74186.1 thioredoxin [Leptospira inadai serovar Lyme]